MLQKYPNALAVNRLSLLKLQLWYLKIGKMKSEPWRTIEQGG